MPTQADVNAVEKEALGGAKGFEYKSDSQTPRP